MWMQARVRLRGGAGPVLAPRDRQRDPVVGAVSYTHLTLPTNSRV